MTGHVLKAWGWPPELGLLAGTAVATLLGVVIGGLAIRRSGIYFAMITLGFAQMIYFLAVQLPFTGGEDGLQGIPRGTAARPGPARDRRSPCTTWSSPSSSLGFFVIHRTIHSPFGHVLRSIRENEPRALSLGYDVDRYKLVAFVISAGLSGLAGATKALVLQFATLTDAHWHKSGEVVLMTLLGGMGTVMGPSVGALVVVTMDNYLSGFGDWVTVIIGVRLRGGGAGLPARLRRRGAPPRPQLPLLAGLGPRGGDPDDAAPRAARRVRHRRGRRHRPAGGPRPRPARAPGWRSPTGPARRSTPRWRR